MPVLLGLLPPVAHLWGLFSDGVIMLVKLVFFTATFILVSVFDICPEATLCSGWQIKIHELFLTDV